jgi:hypothetical protein
MHFMLNQSSNLSYFGAHYLDHRGSGSELHFSRSLCILPTWLRRISDQ